MSTIFLKIRLIKIVNGYKIELAPIILVIQIYLEHRTIQRLYCNFINTKNLTIITKFRYDFNFCVEVSVTYYNVNLILYLNYRL